MLIKREPYKGMEVHQNLDKQCGTTYYSVYNPYTGKHAHTCVSWQAAYRIVDCYYSKHKNKYDRGTRNRALKLEGYAVRY